VVVGIKGRGRGSLESDSSGRLDMMDRAIVVGLHLIDMPRDPSE